MLKYLLNFYVLLLPYEYLFVEFFESRTIFKPYRIIGIVLIVTWGFRKMGSFKLDSYDIKFILFFFWGICLTFFWMIVSGEGEPDYTKHEFTLIFFAFLIYIVVKNSNLNFHDMENLLNTFVAGTVSSIFLMLYLNQFSFTGRFSGFFRNPNSLAFTVGISMLILLSKLLFPKTKFSPLKKTYYISVSILLFIILILSGSRGGTIAFLIGSLILIYFSLGNVTKKRNSRLHQFLIAFVVISAFVLTYRSMTSKDTTGVMKRYEIENMQDTSGRYDLWRSGMNVAIDHYFIGIGMSQYRYYHFDYINKLDYLLKPGSTKHRLGLHSDYADFLVSYGVIGFILFISIYFSLFKKLRLCIKIFQGNYYYFAPLFLGIFCMILIQQSVAMLLLSPLYYFFIALIMVFIKNVISLNKGKNHVIIPSGKHADTLAENMPPHKTVHSQICI